MTNSSAMHRGLGLTDAVTIGIGSMIGAGIFVVFAPAAASAGAWLPAALVLAAVVALCNALSSAQLAAQYPVAGGSYVYGRERLGPWPGFFAGWCFLIGKTASCAAMAMTFSAYVVPEPWQRPIAALAVLGVVTVNCFGVTRTAWATKVLVGIVLLGLAAVVAAGLSAGSGSSAVLIGAAPTGGAYGILQAGGLLFFAFAGYARVATMGEEVRDPSRVIPRAIIISWGVVLAIYGVLAVLSLHVLGIERLSRTTTPLADLAAAADWPWISVVVTIAAAAATLGALLGLTAGIGRTGVAMARTADLPRSLAVLDEHYGVPRRIELVVAAVVVAVVFVMDVRGVVGFSSFGVLLYYLVANLSALTQSGQHRRYPRAVSVMGAVLCVVLVITLPAASVAGGVLVLVLGVVYRCVRMRRR